MIRTPVQNKKLGKHQKMEESIGITSENSNIRGEIRRKINPNNS
jgi:hypothetical protein